MGGPGLKFDLAVIATLHAAALVYGLHAVYLARPVCLVLTKGSAERAQAREALELLVKR